MNKNELAIEVSKRVRIPLKEVISVIDCTLDVIGVTLINDEPFVTNKLGTFYLKRYKQTIGYDPYRKTHIQNPRARG